MVTKCANPLCNHRFKYSNEGKLYYLDRQTGAPAIERLFWLCTDCVAAYTLVFDHQAAPFLIPRLGTDRPRTRAGVI